MTKTWLIAAAVAAALAGTTGAARAKTLVFCSEGAPENFNPMLNTTGTTFDANRPVYDRLVEFQPGSTETRPGLAEKWDISPDGKVFTFHLRHGVKWQSNANFKPTRDFNADDVLFSFERQWKDANPFHKVSGGSYDYFGDMGLSDLLDTIDKVDDYTVKFTLKSPNAPFVADMAMDFATIQSKEYADALTKLGKPELIDQQPIGTGPFSFVQYQQDATIRYKANKEFWGPKAKVDNLVFAITKDPAVRLAKLRAGECQVADYPNPADLPSIKSDPKLQLLSQPGLNIGYVAMNTTKKPFDDVRVRTAINMAIDKKTILDAIYQGAGEPAKNLIPPTLWSYDKDIVDFKYDPEAAKKMLAEAGVKDGFETDLWAMPVQRPYNPNGRRMAELIQADLAKVGIKANIVSYEWGEYRKRLQQGEAMMAEFGWTGDNGDPDNFFVPIAGCDAARIGGGNVAKWCDKSFDDVVKRAAMISNQAERAVLYKQAQEIMHKQAPFLLVAHSVVFMPMAKTVTGYKSGARWAATSSARWSSSRSRCPRKSRALRAPHPGPLPAIQGRGCRSFPPLAGRGSSGEGASAGAASTHDPLPPPPHRADRADLHRRDPAGLPADPLWSPAIRSRCATASAASRPSGWRCCATRLGLDQPLWRQFVQYEGQVAHRQPRPLDPDARQRLARVHRAVPRHARAVRLRHPVRGRRRPAAGRAGRGAARRAAGLRADERLGGRRVHADLLAGGSWPS